METDDTDTDFCFTSVGALAMRIVERLSAERNEQTYEANGHDHHHGSSFTKSDCERDHEVTHGLSPTVGFGFGESLSASFLALVEPLVNGVPETGDLRPMGTNEIHQLGFINYDANLPLNEGRQQKFRIEIRTLEFTHAALPAFGFEKQFALPPAANDRAGLERAKVN